MEKIFEWFNEKTQREKILLFIIPFGLAIALYLFLIQPLIEEKKKLEKELSDVRNITFLLAKKKAIEKEVKDLKKAKELEDISLKDIYELAISNRITILETEVLSKKGVSISKRGQNLYIERGKKSGLKGNLNIYQMKVIASKDNLYKFFKALTKNRLAFIAGVYHGCVSESEFNRRKNPPLICETSKSNYKRFLCDKDVSKIPKYIITIVSLDMED